MNLAEIVLAVADALADVEDLTVYPHPLTAVPAGEQDIAAVRIGADIDLQQAGAAGLAWVPITVEINVQASDDAAPYERMLELLSSGSGEYRSAVDALQNAYRADRDAVPPGPLSGIVVHTASPPRFEQPAPDQGGPRLLVAEIRLDVPTPRT